MSRRLEPYIRVEKCEFQLFTPRRPCTSHFSPSSRSSGAARRVRGERAAYRGASAAYAPRRPSRESASRALFIAESVRIVSSHLDTVNAVRRLLAAPTALRAALTAPSVQCSPHSVRPVNGAWPIGASSPIRVEECLLATISNPPPPAASVTVHLSYHGHGHGRRRHSHALRCARTRRAAA